jgi:hypothetical protein
MKQTGIARPVSQQALLNWILRTDVMAFVRKRGTA